MTLGNKAERSEGGRPSGPPFDQRDVEIARLKKELDELRAREGVVRKELEEAHKRFTLLSEASKRFASSMRGRTDERQRYRQSLATQYAVSRLLAQAHDLDEAASEIMEIFGQRLNWEVGILWMLDEDALRCEKVWRLRATSLNGFEDACRQARLRRSVGLPGRAWVRGQPVWAEDIFKEETPLREAVAGAGLRGALAFPIGDGNLYGVFEFFCRKTLVLDEDMLYTAGVIGQQVSQFVERRRAERVRDRSLIGERKARRELSGILESISDAFFALDAQWRFTYVNHRAEELWSRSREELVGQVIWEEFPEAIGSDSYRQIERAVEEGRTTEFETVSPVLGTWISGRVYPSAQGGVSVYFQDVTERKRAEEQIRFQAHLLEQVEAAVIATDLEGTVTHWNKHAQQLYGWSREEALNRNIMELTVGPMEAEVAEETMEQLRGGETWEGEFIVRRKDGSTFPAHITASPIYDAVGCALGIVGVSTDIAERKKAEEDRERFLAREWMSHAQAEERRRISRELHDRVAHSMGVVHQSLELYQALKERAPAKAEAKMELARQMAKEALAYTRDLSMELRRPEVQRGLEAALVNLLREVVPQTIHSKLSIEGDEALVPPDTRNQLFLILREAVRNAVGHSGCERLTVELDVAPQGVAGTVEDNGRGFDVEQRRSGSGLESMEERAALLGGTFGISSEPGAGTKIEVSVPLKDA